MVICFLKDPTEVRATCHIEKFLDRIWLDERGDADVLRTVIVRVDPNSEEKISSLSLLTDRQMPREAFQDVSETGLNEGFYWNQRESRPLETADASSRLIIYDGLPGIRVPEKVSAKMIPIGPVSLLEIDLGLSLSPGEGVFLRFKMKIRQFAEIQPNGNLNFYTRYLSSERAKDILDQLDMPHREIPVLSIFDEETKLGGFDVFVTPPQGTQITAEFLSPNMRGRTTRDIEGKEIGPRHSRHWRLRFMTGGKDLKKANKGMSIAGAAIRDDLAERLSRLSSSERKHHVFNVVWHIVAVMIGISALIIALLRK